VRVIALQVRALSAAVGKWRRATGIAAGIRVHRGAIAALRVRRGRVASPIVVRLPADQISGHAAAAEQSQSSERNTYGQSTIRGRRWLEHGTSSLSCRDTWRPTPGSTGARLRFP
jgi:hypothetical protein